MWLTCFNLTDFHRVMVQFKSLINQIKNITIKWFLIASWWTQISIKKIENIKANHTDIMYGNGVNDSEGVSLLSILLQILIMGSSLAIGESLRDAMLQTIHWCLEMDTGPGTTWIVFTILVAVCIPTIFLMHCFVERRRKRRSLKRAASIDLK